MKQKSTSLIPSQGTCLGWGSEVPSRGRTERQPPVDVSLLLFLPSPLSKIKYSKKWRHLELVSSLLLSKFLVLLPGSGSPTSGEQGFVFFLVPCRAQGRAVRKGMNNGARSEV